MDTRTREADTRNATDTADPGISLSCCLRPKTYEDTEKRGRMLRNVKVNNARSLGEWQLLTKVLVSCEKGNNGCSSFSSQDSGKN